MSVKALCLVVLAFTLSVSACRPVRNAPVPAGATWSVLLERGSRNPFEGVPGPRTLPTERWRTRVGNGLGASPILLRDVLVVTTTNRFVTTVSPETGEVYWERRKSGPFSSPPVADESGIYAVTHDVEGRAYSLRPRDGDEQWDRRVPGSAVSATLTTQHLVISAGDGRLLALTRSNGEPGWTRRLGTRLTSTPVPWEGSLLVVSNRDSLYAVDAGTGRVLDRHGLASPLSGQPALSGPLSRERLVLALESGEVVAIDPDGLGEVWRTDVGAPALATPVVSRSGDVYVLTRDGSVWRIGPDGRDARALARLDSAATRSLTLAGGVLLVGLLDGRLAALDAESGDELWSLGMGDSVYDPALMTPGGTIIVPLRRGTLVGLAP